MLTIILLMSEMISEIKLSEMHHETLIILTLFLFLCKNIYMYFLHFTFLIFCTNEAFLILISSIAKVKKNSIFPIIFFNYNSK